MVYVYDVLVNLNEMMYDFYDWEDSDNFIHVRRVPIFRVSKDTLIDMISKKVKVSEEFLSIIKDKTQVFSSRNIEVIHYSCVFSNSNSAFMIEFKDNGEVKKKSKFLINEEVEILEIAEGMKECNIDYVLLSKRIEKNAMIRSEKKLLDSIIRELDSIKEDEERINYLYYEWFETEEGVNKYDRLVKDIKSKFTSKHKEFLELLNLLTIKK